MLRLLALVLAVAAAACTATPPAPAPGAAAGPQPSTETISLLGTGAMGPLATALAKAWAKAGRTPQLRVEPSVGSAGGIRAASEGAVDLGMISRSFQGNESALGLQVIPIAVDAVVLAAHPSVSLLSVTAQQLRALYAGEGDGSVTLLLRDPQESANGALEKVYPELKPLREEAYRSHRFRVLYHDDEMARALMGTPGTVGVYNLGGVLAAQLPLKSLALDGVEPSVHNLASGLWKPVRPVAFVVRPERRARVQPVLDFLASPEGQQLMVDAGYLPWRQGHLAW